MQLDAAAVEAFNWDVVPATGATATATLDAFKAGLWDGVVGLAITATTTAASTTRASGS